MRLRGGRRDFSLKTEERILAILCHVGPFVALPVILPLIVRLWKGDSPFVRHHAKEAVAFQLGVLIALFISALLFIILLGIALFFIVSIYALVMTGIAVVKAAEGQMFRFPLTTQFAQRF